MARPDEYEVLKTPVRLEHSFTVHYEIEGAPPFVIPEVCRKAGENSKPIEVKALSLTFTKNDYDDDVLVARVWALNLDNKVRVVNYSVPQQFGKVALAAAPEWVRISAYDWKAKN